MDFRVNRAVTKLQRQFRQKRIRRHAAHHRMSAQDQFVFYSKSADVRPGKGAHEHVDDPAAYRALAAVPNWRKMLSNFDAAPFVWTGSDVLPVPYPAGAAWRSNKRAVVLGHSFLKRVEFSFLLNVHNALCPPTAPPLRRKKAAPAPFFKSETIYS